MIRWLFLLLFCAAPVCAGPWLRAKGTGFSATTVELAPADTGATAPYPPAYAVDAYNTVYAEYGLTPRLTLGLDGGGDMYGNGMGLVFLRFPLHEGRTARIAGEIAIGAGWSTTDLTPLLRPGLSWGRGVTLFETHGWASLDATVLLPANGNRPVPKLDAMLGLNTGKRAKLMLGLTLERPAPTLSPAFAYRVWDRFHFTIGAKLRIAQTRPHALALGFWHEF